MSFTLSGHNLCNVIGWHCLKMSLMWPLFSPLPAPHITAPSVCGSQLWKSRYFEVQGQQVYYYKTNRVRPHSSPPTQHKPPSLSAQFNTQFLYPSPLPPLPSLHLLSPPLLPSLPSFLPSPPPPPFLSSPSSPPPPHPPPPFPSSSPLHRRDTALVQWT